ncbi:MAG TPA: hypothetical protein VGJ20_19900 [Xanthobacteraceae bacterium]
MGIPGVADKAAFRALVLSIVVLMAGCARFSSDWHTADGQPVSPEDVQAAQTACKGEVQTATEQGGYDHSSLGGLILPHPQDVDIFNGCMIARGYLEDK